MGRVYLSKGVKSRRRSWQTLRTNRRTTSSVGGLYHLAAVKNFLIRIHNNHDTQTSFHSIHRAIVYTTVQVLATLANIHIDQPPIVWMDLLSIASLLGYSEPSCSPLYVVPLPKSSGCMVFSLCGENSVSVCVMFAYERIERDRDRSIHGKFCNCIHKMLIMFFSCEAFLTYSCCAYKCIDVCMLFI